MSLFDIRDLTNMGKVEGRALRQVALPLDGGEFVVLLGPSGSGKSTFVEHHRLDVPTSGQVFYRAIKLTQADEAALTAYRRQNVGFMFQFYNLLPSLTAVENVELVRDISDHPVSPPKALRLVNLTERATHVPAQLSGGGQQRVIAKRPAVLLCDEPTGALDISTGIVVLESRAQLNAARISARRPSSHAQRNRADGRSRDSRGRRPGNGHRRAHSEEAGAARAVMMIT